MPEVGIFVRPWLVREIPPLIGYGTCMVSGAVATRRSITIGHPSRVQAARGAAIWTQSIHEEEIE
jgi:hypothetical protein